MPAIAPEERRGLWPSASEGGIGLLVGELSGESRWTGDVRLPGEVWKPESVGEVEFGRGPITMFSLRSKLQSVMGAYCASERSRQSTHNTNWKGAMLCGMKRTNYIFFIADSGIAEALDIDWTICFFAKASWINGTAGFFSGLPNAVKLLRCQAQIELLNQERDINRPSCM